MKKLFAISLLIFLTLTGCLHEKDSSGTKLVDSPRLSTATTTTLQPNPPGTSKCHYRIVLELTTITYEKMLCDNLSKRGELILFKLVIADKLCKYEEGISTANCDLRNDTQARLTDSFTTQIPGRDFEELTDKIQITVSVTATLTSATYTGDDNATLSAMNNFVRKAFLKIRKVCTDPTFTLENELRPCTDMENNSFTLYLAERVYGDFSS